jgi:hypothetical protein
MSQTSQRAHEQARLFVKQYEYIFSTNIDFWVQIISIQFLKFHQEETREQTENIEREIAKYL